MKKVVVIGAGTAGLAAAVRLQHKGYDVTIYEKNKKIGGRMYQLDIEGFKFDVGPTIVMMKDIYEELFIYTGVNPNNYIRMVRLDPMFKLEFPDGTILHATNDLVKMTEDNEMFSEKDAQGYLAYLADVYKRYLVAKKYFIERSFRKPSDFYNLGTMRQALKLKTFSNAYDSIGKFVESEKLKQSLAFQTLYIGVSPFTGPSIYTIIPMIELLYGVWYIKGGMYQMAKAMEKRFLELGGTIKLNQNVEEIVIENKVAKGIIVNDEMIEADIVLSNADFPYAMDNLIRDNKYKKKYIPKKIDKMTYSSSSFMIYLGMKKKYQTSLHTIYFTSNFKKNVDDLFMDNIPDDPSFYVYSPTQLDESLAPADKEVLYILVPVPNLHHTKNKWDKKEEYADFILDILSKKEGFENVKNDIEVMKIFTPHDFEEKFNLKFGATFGLRPTLLQSNYFRPQVKSKYVNNLYFTGSSNHPGAGVPIVLTSSKLAVNEILKDDKNE
ncbi:phytoene desaturase family protein [Haploplasma axanthum]|uniref:Dehydrosqualene desaturase n=1 Tax=Haploplasma axanthum TaxID=29552 RepID=A0A449BG23_HAPAX|nr:phytoene desaturase family protein [Haploplasma axanthum]VEU81240.1 Dehydrosqualene desaturase [Haploplasma axanthum]